MQQRAFAARARAALRAQRACAWVAGWLCSVVAAMSKDTVLVTVMHSNNEVPVPSPSPSPSLSHHLASRLGPRDRELTWSVGAACLPACLPAATAHTHTHTHAHTRARFHCTGGVGAAGGCHLRCREGSGRHPPRAALGAQLPPHYRHWQLQYLALCMLCQRCSALLCSVSSRPRGAAKTPAWCTPTPRSP
jgi:hypothetical protein